MEKRPSLSDLEITVHPNYIGIMLVKIEGKIVADILVLPGGHSVGGEIFWYLVSVSNSLSFFCTNLQASREAVAYFNYLQLVENLEK